MAADHVAPIRRRTLVWVEIGALACFAVGIGLAIGLTGGSPSASHISAASTQKDRSSPFTTISVPTSTASAAPVATTSVPPSTVQTRDTVATSSASTTPPPTTSLPTTTTTLPNGPITHYIIGRPFTNGSIWTLPLGEQTPTANALECEVQGSTTWQMCNYTVVSDPTGGVDWTVLDTLHVNIEFQALTVIYPSGQPVVRDIWVFSPSSGY